VALNKARLDAALQESLRQLRIKADEPQSSRKRLVAAADEELRRIERNLHDGAQQHLVALSVKVRLLEQLSEKNPERARVLIDTVAQRVFCRLFRVSPATSPGYCWLGRVGSPAAPASRPDR
jgi:signal transduction histidine kinase